MSLSIDSEILADARSEAGERGLSAFVTEAIRKHLRGEHLRQWLEQMDEKYGPVPEAMIEEARKKWQVPDTPSKRRKSA